jgi:hypothetical protein
LSKILYESLTFSASAGTAGLQLVDIVTNAFRRAMMGRLSFNGFERIGELMVRIGRSPFELHLFSSTTTLPSLDEYTDPHEVIKGRSRIAGTPP